MYLRGLVVESWSIPVNFYDMFMAPLEKRVLARIRGRIIPQSFGNVLEIGYGTGANFPYYKAALVKKISALDKRDPSSTNQKTAIPLELYQGRAENLPFPEETFDTVVETPGLLQCGRSK